MRYILTLNKMIKGLVSCFYFIIIIIIPRVLKLAQYVYPEWLQYYCTCRD